MIRLTIPELVANVQHLIMQAGSTVHLDESRELIVMTPEMFEKCIEAARESALNGAYIAAADSNPN